MGNYHSDTAYFLNQYESKRYEWEIYLYESLTHEINIQTSEITRQVNLISDYRNDIKNQIEKIAVSTFGSIHKNIEAHVYGSVATGLALLESDMDIVLTGITSYKN